MSGSVSVGFQNDSLLAQAVLTAIKSVAVIVLAIWMARLA